MISIEKGEMEFIKSEGMWYCKNERLGKKLAITNLKLIECLNNIEELDIDWNCDKLNVIKYIMIIMLKELEGLAND